MTKEVVTANPDTPLKTCADLLRIHSISALPIVFETGELAGILSEADLLAKEADAPRAGEPADVVAGLRANARTAGDLMTRSVATISRDASLPEAARHMIQKGVKRLVVADPEGRPVGIVSRSDVLRVFLRSDESIRREAQELITNPLLVGASRLRIDVRDGVVRLSGVLESGNLTRLLVGLLAGIAGVVSVDNHTHATEEPVLSYEDS